MQVYVLSSSSHPESAGGLFNNLLATNTDLLAHIITVIKHIMQVGGHPQPPYAKPLKEVNNEICEMRIKYDEENLLRIYYFVEKSKDHLVLLNIIIKPDGRNYPSSYQGTKRKKLQQEIQQSIQLALQFKKEYSSNQSHYEPFC